MGSVCDKLNNDEELEKYVGRDANLKKARDLLNDVNVRVIGIFGMQSIGKSRFLSELIKGTPTATVTYYDFVLDDVNDFDVQRGWLDSFYRRLGCDNDVKKFHKRFPEGTTQWGNVEECSGHTNRCPALDSEIKIAVKCLKNRSKTIILLDNIDSLVEAKGIKDIFLDFLQWTSFYPKVKIVVTSTNTINMLQKFNAITLEPIDWKASLDLLYECVELRKYHDSEDGDNPKTKSRTSCFNVNNKVFKPENERIINDIVKLCEGLPSALKITGNLLLEDDYLFSPADAIQLLILSRVQVLSPDNAPSSDKLDSQKNKIEELKNDFKNFYENINKQMTSDGCAVDELASPGLEAASNAQVKRYYIQPLTRKNLMTHKGGMLHVHGVLKECVTMMKVVRISTDLEEAKQWVKSCIKEHAKLTSLDIPDDCLNDPKKLEDFIQHLPEPCNGELGDDCNDRTESTTIYKRQEYSSTIGPLALSYQKESSEQSQERLEKVTDNVDAVKKLGRDKDDKTTFLSRQTSDETLNSETYTSELGSLVCQPKN